LTLDDELAERIADLASKTGKPFKVDPNDTLRSGFAESAPEEPEFLVRPHPGNLLPSIDDHQFNELAWEVPATKQ
jgi:hypothetical protein